MDLYASLWKLIHNKAAGMNCGEEEITHSCYQPEHNLKIFEPWPDPDFQKSLSEMFAS